MTGFGLASDLRALAMVTDVLRADDSTVFGAVQPDAGQLVKALGDAEGVIGEWMALTRRPGGMWLFCTDPVSLAAAGGAGDVVVMLRHEDAGVLCTALGVLPPDPRVTMARVIGATVPALLLDAMNAVDPPPGAGN